MTRRVEATLRGERDDLERRVLGRTEALRAQNDYLAGIVETIREALLVLDTDQRVRFANDAFYQTFRVSREETEGKRLFELGNGQWNIPTLRALLSDVLPEHRSLENFDVEHDFPGIGHGIMIVNARQIRLRGTGQDTILVRIERSVGRGITIHLGAASRWCLVTGPVIDLFFTLGDVRDPRARGGLRNTT